MGGDGLAEPVAGLVLEVVLAFLDSRQSAHS